LSKNFFWKNERFGKWKTNNANVCSCASRVDGWISCWTICRLFSGFDERLIALKNFATDLTDKTDFHGFIKIEFVIIHAIRV
jgi:hypothetical protein